MAELPLTLSLRRQGRGDEPVMGCVAPHKKGETDDTQAGTPVPPRCVASCKKGETDGEYEICGTNPLF